MKKRTIFSVLLIVALLTSCSGSAKSGDMSYDGSLSYTSGTRSKNFSTNLMGINGGFKGEIATDDIYVPQEPEAIEHPAPNPDIGAEDITQNYDEKKIVYSASIDMEAKDIEAALKTIKTNIDSMKGYIQSENRDNWNSFDANRYMNRSSQLSIRIPSENFEAFLDGLNSEEMIITNLNKSSIDYSESYYDKEIRIETLGVQEDRLLELLANANDVSVMLQIENRLSEVRYEIESLTKELRTIDSKVQYSTIDIYISEVMRYSSPVTEPKGFIEELGEAFKDSAENLVYFLRDLSISLAYNSLSILFVIIVIAVIVVVIRKKRAKKKNRVITKNADTNLKDNP